MQIRRQVVGNVSVILRPCTPSALSATRSLGKRSAFVVGLLKPRYFLDEHLLDERRQRWCTVCKLASSPPCALESRMQSPGQEVRH